MASGDGASLPPPMMWAQRNDKIFLTINLEDVENPEIKLEETKLYFKGKGGKERKLYEVTFEFHKEVDPSESKYGVLPRHVPMVIKKKEDGPYWPRLQKAKLKPHFLKTDFDKWKDEDDSDNEGGNQDFQLEDMMGQMGNFDQAGDMGMDDEDDSDDDDLPDLADTSEKSEDKDSSKATKADATEAKESK